MVVLLSNCGDCCSTQAIASTTTTAKILAVWPYTEFNGLFDLVRRDSLVADCSDSNPYLRGWNGVRTGKGLASDTVDCLKTIGLPIFFSTSVDFSNRLFSPESRGVKFRFAPLGLAYSKFGGDATFAASQFESVPADFNRTLFSGRLDFTDVVLSEDVSCSFQNAIFRGPTSFSRSQLGWSTSFDGAHFDSAATVDFSKTNFRGVSSFEDVVFGGSLVFAETMFRDSISLLIDFPNPHFRNAQFLGLTRFQSIQFANPVDFTTTQFGGDGALSIHNSRFWATPMFRGVVFSGPVTWRTVDCDNLVAFWGSRFSDSVDFYNVRFLRDLSFNHCQFLRPLDHETNPEKMHRSRVFRFESSTVAANVSFDNSFIARPLDLRGLSHDTASTTASSTVTFWGANLCDTLFVGNRFTSNSLYLDLTRCQLVSGDLRSKLVSLYSDSLRAQGNFFQPRLTEASFEDRPGAPAIVISAPIRLKIQIEKFNILSIEDSLSYYDKKEIIEYLKAESFASNDQKAERLELDYLLARSVAYQKVATTYEPYDWKNLPQIVGSWLHSATLGFGYRPFKLLYWALGFALAFAAMYFWMHGHADAITRYVKKLSSAENTAQVNWGSRIERFYYCLWFSITVLLAIRLKPQLLTSFDHRQKRFILTEYLVGIGLYAYFIFASKAGSISTRIMQLLGQ